jgi:hypothetical protein
MSSRADVRKLKGKYGERGIKMNYSNITAKSRSYGRDSNMASPELEVRQGSLHEGEEAGGLDTTDQDKLSTA